jgi:hypothetical protein
MNTEHTDRVLVERDGPGDRAKDQLTAKTWIPLGSLIGIFLVGMAIYGFFDNKFDSITLAVNNLQTQVKSATEFRWSSNNAQTAWVEFVAANPKSDGSHYTVPDIMKIVKESREAKGN